MGPGWHRHDDPVADAVRNAALEGPPILRVHRRGGSGDGTERAIRGDH